MLHLRSNKGKPMNKAKNLVWIDLEMTGLLPASDRIIEIASVADQSGLSH